MSTNCSIFPLVFLTLLSFISAENIPNTTISANPEKRKNSTEEGVKQRTKWTKWEDYKECGIQEICLNDAEHCESKLRLKDLENEEEVVYIDLTQDLFVEKQVKVNLTVLKRYIDKMCDLAFVSNRSKSNCMVMRTPNRCDWRAKWTRADCYVVETKDSKFIGGDIPRDCTQGPGWRGELETSKGPDGTYKIKWSSLVKNPRCFFWIKLVDEEANLGKYFWGTMCLFQLNIWRAPAT